MLSQPLRTVYMEYSCLGLPDKANWYLFQKKRFPTGLIVFHEKLKNKYCDLIVANDVSKKHTGLSVDYNKVSIIQKNGKIENIPRNKKSYIASLIAKKILDKFLVDDKNIN